LGIDVGSQVRFKKNPERLNYLNEEMKKFMIEHPDVLVVEKVHSGAAKLRKYGFWVTFDLLEEA
jgi:hypothetical protein